MPGSFSKGFTFAEDLVTGKARISGRTASLLGLEKFLHEEQMLTKNKANSKKLNRVKEDIQSSIDRILLLHSVSASMPSLFFIYYGDEIGKLNDYQGHVDPGANKDIRYLVRGTFNWDVIDTVENDPDSYQAKIFNGIKSIINARLKCPFFTENKKTVFIKSFVSNYYYDPKFSFNEKLEVDYSLLIFKRFRNDDNFLLFIFNFCKYQRTIHVSRTEFSGKFKDLITGQVFDQIDDMKIKGYGFLWLEPISDSSKTSDSM